MRISISASGPTVWEKKTRRKCPFCGAKNVVLTYKEFQQIDNRTGDMDTVLKKVHLCKSCNRSKMA